MTQISNIHYIVHPLWYLDNHRDETISLVDKLIELGRVHGQNTSTMFVMDMNDPAEYFDTRPREWSDEKLEEERRIVKELHGEYAPKLEQELGKSCRDLFIGKPIVSKRINKRTWQDYFSEDFSSFLEERKLYLTNPLQITGHGASRDACVTYASEYLAKYIRNINRIRVNVVIPEETTLE